MHTTVNVSRNASFNRETAEAVEKTKFSSILSDLIIGPVNEDSRLMHTPTPSAIKFHISDDKNHLHIYNAERVVKILNYTGKVILIQTVPQNNEPVTFKIKKLKRGTYFIQASGRQYTFIKS